MGGTACEALLKSKELSKRRAYSEERLAALRERFSTEPVLDFPFATYFCAGSIGRKEAGPQSDLDIFVLSDESSMSRLRQFRVLSRIADLNDELNFPPFSDEMRYMKVYDTAQLIEDTGRPRDDSENSFTTRMLLILESASVLNSDLYDQIVFKVCENYFRDNKGKKDFKLIFLINDLLRYWRTLCLNYEQCRCDPSKPWRKKNINLKFSRLTTVFSTIAMLMVENPQSAESLVPSLKMTPLERLAKSVDNLGDSGLSADFPLFVMHYAAFLRIKDNPNPERLLEMRDTKEKIVKSSDFISDYFHRIFLDEKLKDYYRYLMI